MDLDLDQRTVRLGVGELAEFSLGPRDPLGGPSGPWRALLGSRWHRELQARTAAEHPASEFEVAVEGAVFHRGWTLRLGGRIDQIVRQPGGALLREIKTVTRELPAAEEELRREYPGYFAQAAAYLVLRPGEFAAGELLFVEIDRGITQAVALGEADRARFELQLERVAEFLDLRLRARERLRTLRFRPAFERLRPGQEAVRGDLEEALSPDRSKVLLEAPTGFGKTGVLLEFGLEQLRAGRFERLLYLTSKSTGQLQVNQTLERMTAPGPEGPAGRALATWVVRPKSEHCVNVVFHCLRGSCPYLDELEERWPESGLSRFYLFEDQARDLPALRAAGREARICPYEITRSALPANDVWIGDYNYVFSPSASRVFYDQPGFLPARTLLLIDEAHNLPSRVADCYSHLSTAERAREVAVALSGIGAPPMLTVAWEQWLRFLERLAPAPELDRETVGRALGLLADLAGLISAVPLDYAALGPGPSELLWQIPALAETLDSSPLPRLDWCPRAGHLALTCLDAAPAIAERLGAFGGVILASATPGPVEDFTRSAGLEPGELRPVRAATPWRDDAYDVAFDLRVDTTFQQRARHYAITARTLEAFAGDGRIAAVFFPSFAYAEAIAAELEGTRSSLRVALQPRLPDLTAQAAWVEEALASTDALFLILGSSFAESIDVLGGRVELAVVVGPALPEVNAVQRARMAALADEGRDAAFRRVYQIPGMQKVNQALGRLVRAPGQHARVLLHCRRFAEPAYARLLAPDYQGGPRLRSDQDLAAWIAGPRHEDL